MAAMVTVYLLLVGVLLIALKTVQCNAEEASPMDIMKHEMPESCQGQPYCFEKGDNYPDELIEKLLIDMLESEVDQYTPQAIGSRYGDTYDEPDCPVNSMEGPIYYITDTDGNVRVVVQSPKKFQQIYSAKWCANEGPIKGETAHFLTPTLRRFKMECVTTKMNFDFLVLNDDLSDLKMEIASAKDGIPVCCRCRYNKRN